ncbi:polysaccharide deacetylase family protein [Shimia sp.]|uniref:polysaccharide deacetylase family protein n=1 Tax=Shimia sp. TaxID=1954381 RepID=UPI003297EEC2
MANTIQPFDPRGSLQTNFPIILERNGPISQTIPILLYHSVSDQFDQRYGRWCVTPRRFEEQMSALAEGGFHAISISDLAQKLAVGLPVPDRCVAVTFDDGLKDFQSGALPVLTKFGFAATLYVVAGSVGKTSGWLAALGEDRRPMLQPEDMLELLDAGIEIGAHSMTHPELDILDRKAACEEIRTSRIVLEDALSAPVQSFAYPFGYASTTTRALVRKAGFRSAVVVRHALSSPDEDLFGLSRLIVTEQLSGSDLLELIHGKGAKPPAIQHKIKTDIWRLVRRVRRLHRDGFSAGSRSESKDLGRMV